jgi:hypothetical protein
VANQAKWQRRAKKSSKTQKAHKTQKLSLTLSMQALPLGRYYHVSSLNHPISKNSTNFVHNLSPFDNELIKHKSREERDAIHEIKIRLLHKAYKQVFKQLYISLCQDWQNKSETSQRDQYRITS